MHRAATALAAAPARTKASQSKRVRWLGLKCVEVAPSLQSRQQLYGGVYTTPRPCACYHRLLQGPACTAFLPRISIRQQTYRQNIQARDTVTDTTASCRHHIAPCLESQVRVGEHLRDAALCVCMCANCRQGKNNEAHAVERQEEAVVTGKGGGVTGSQRAESLKLWCTVPVTK